MARRVAYDDNKENADWVELERSGAVHDNFGVRGSHTKQWQYMIAVLGIVFIIIFGVVITQMLFATAAPG